jgi:DEAD/DEAH box helicase domain-containing protein
VATSALELGIDIGAMDAAVLIGYPGSIAATRQQAGRAGRQLSPALAILITAANAMDQYLSQHPDYIFDRAPERALIAPDNLLILLQHIRCAAFELPFQKDEGFGAIPADKIKKLLDILAQSGELHQQGDRFFWMADQYPAAEISLRNATPDKISLVISHHDRVETIGQIDRNSAYWMVHPEGIYLHEGMSYIVKELNLETGVARLESALVDYYTQAKKETRVEEESRLKQVKIPGATKCFGEILVTTQVKGYRRIRWFTHENMGSGEVKLPEVHLNTMGFWLSLDDATVQSLQEQKLWNSGQNDYGPDWDTIRQRVLRRDGRTCQVCGTSIQVDSLHVHHIKPFKSFHDRLTANQLSNLITLCPTCHRRAESRVRIRSGMAGFSYVMHSLAPLLIMCDGEDIDVHYDPDSSIADGKPTVVFFDNIPGGLGLSETLFDHHVDLLQKGYETIAGCHCEDGCPSCVGPVGEESSGSKNEALAIFKALLS